MTIRCPHCQAEVDSSSPSPSGDVVCPGCGSSFNVVGRETIAWGAHEGRKHLGRFELLDVVGVGAFGTVYQARDPELDRIVAIKVPRTGQLGGKEDFERFLRESRSVAKLQHPLIVPVYEVGQADGAPFLVSEFVHGVALADRLTAGRMPFEESAELVAKVADALQYAHEQGVVHRDVKPGNIMLETAGADSAAAPGTKMPEGDSAGSSAPSEGMERTDKRGSSRSRRDVGRPATSGHRGASGNLRPRLMDFGLARREAGDVTMTTEGQVLGTPAYMSPEQAAGESHQVDGRSDVYSLGVVLYELLTGEMPFRGNQRMLIHQVLHDEPRQPRSLNDRIPRDLETICLRAMQKSPARRYASAGEMGADLGRWLRREPILARPVGPLERLVRCCQRRPGIAAMSTALVVVALLGFAGITWQWLSAAAARDVAARQRDRANQERDRANDERQRADDQRKLADAASEQARRERDAARWQTYRASIGAASSALELQNAPAARRSLEAAPVEHRNFEWQHLASRLVGPHTVLGAPEAVPASITFSHDGRLLAIGSKQGPIALQEAASGRVLHALEGHAGSVHRLAFTRDNRVLASGGADTSVRLWDAATGGHLRTLSGHTHHISSLDFSPDGARLASASFDHTVRIWDVESGRPLHLLQGMGGGGEVRFSRDGTRVLCGFGDHMIRVWNAQTGEPAGEWSGHTAGIFCLAQSADGTRIVSGGTYPDNTARIWNAQTGETIAVLRGHKNMVWNVAFNPDASRVATASMDQTAMLWDGKTGERIAVLWGHKSYVYHVAFSPDGSRLATCSEDGTARLWDVATGDLRSVLFGHSDRVWSADYRPDGKALVTRSDDGTVRVWDTELIERSGVLQGHTSYVYDVAFSPDGTQVASAAWDGTVRLWDATTGRELRRFKLGHEVVTSVAIGRDGQRLAVASRDDRVSVWDIASGERVLALSVPTASVASDPVVAFDAQGRYLASGAGDGGVRLWESASGDPVAVLRGHEGAVGPVEFSPDGRLLAAGDVDSIVRLWDVKTRDPVKVLRGHLGGVVALAFSADGRWLASGSADKTVRLWDMNTHAEVAVLTNPAVIYGLDFSPDGTRLAAGCGDSTIRLWDLATREEVAELRGHEAYVHAVAFSPDGTRLVSASGDFTVRIWDTLPVQVRARPAEEYVAPKGYVCYRAGGPIEVDGQLEEAAWQGAPWTEDFVDIEGDRRIAPRFRTRAKMLWDEEYFYVAAEMEEPHVWGTLTKHDSVIFHDNDFEVFLDPDGDNHNYGEFEINALGTTWDLRLPKPYKDGGKPENAWEIPGLKTAVHVDGTPSDPRDTDRLWTVELAFPWKSLAGLTEKTDRSSPPRDGDQWRVNFSRVEWRHEIVEGKYRKVAGRREDNWVWSPQWTINMHRPETWGYVQFSTDHPPTAAPGSTAPATEPAPAQFRPDSAGPARHLLHRVYYAQREFFEKHNRYANSLDDLRLAALAHEGLAGPLVLQVSPAGSAPGFTVTADVKLSAGQTERWQIREDSRVTSVK